MLAVFVCCPIAALAEPPASSAPTDQSANTAAPTFPKFDILRFEVAGNSLLDVSAIDKLLQPYTGKQKDFGDIEQALEALQQAYVSAGYSAVQVRLPEQDVVKGVVTFRVIEGKVAHILVKGNAFHDEANIKAAVPALKVGSAPRAKRIGTNLKVANQNPSKKTQVFLKTTDKPGEIDATLQVADQKTSKFGVVADNTGTPETGNYRIGVFYQNSNVDNKDQVLNMQLSTSPEHPGRVKIFGAGYHIPLYALGDSVDIMAGYSDVTFAGVQNLSGFNGNGGGTILGVRYNHNLKSRGNYDQKLVYGLDYKAYNSIQLATFGSIKPRITTHPVSVSYVGEWHPRNRYVSFYVGEAANIPGGAQGGTSDFAAFFNSPTYAKANFMITKYGVDYTQAYKGDWQSHLGLSGQYTANALINYEQFGMGGESSVRGFYERELSNDKGYRGTAEFYTPDFGDRFGGEVKERALVFCDFAEGADNVPGVRNHHSIGSVGVGLRASVGGNFSVLADFAQVVVTDPAAKHFKNDKRLHFSMVMTY